MSALEGDEEGKEEKGLKILTSNRLLTKFPVLIGQIKPGNNSDKVNTKSDKYWIFCINTMKSLKELTTN